jgi:hypothetical protein
VTHEHNSNRQFSVAGLMKLVDVLSPLFLSLNSIYYWVWEHAFLQRRLANNAHVIVYVWLLMRWWPRVPASGLSVRKAMSYGCVLGTLFGLLYTVPWGLVIIATELARLGSLDRPTLMAVLVWVMVFGAIALWAAFLGAAAGAVYGLCAKFRNRRCVGPD